MLGAPALGPGAWAGAASGKCWPYLGTVCAGHFFIGVRLARAAKTHHNGTGIYERASRRGLSRAGRQRARSGPWPAGRQDRWRPDLVARLARNQFAGARPGRELAARVVIVRAAQIDRVRGRARGRRRHDDRLARPSERAAG